jgi:hypothetical protein
MIIFHASKFLPPVSIAVLSPCLFAITEIHISPVGKDISSGTAGLTVATPQRAQELVRGLIAAGLKEKIDIIFADGIHQLDAPLELRPEDSGTADFPITWKAAGGSTPVLSGGKTITGTWTDAGEGIWQIDLQGVGLGSDEWNMTQGHNHGFAVEIGKFRFKAGQNAVVTLSSTGTNGLVIADSVAFVKVKD